MMDVHQTYYSDHFMMFVGQIIVLCILDLYRAMGYLYLNKTEKIDIKYNRLC